MTTHYNPAADPALAATLELAAHLETLARQLRKASATVDLAHRLGRASVALSLLQDRADEIGEALTELETWDAAPAALAAALASLP